MLRLGAGNSVAIEPEGKSLCQHAMILKGDLSHHKKIGINQKFKCKPQVAYHICSFTRMTSLPPRHDLIIQNFATS